MKKKPSDPRAQIDDLVTGEIIPLHPYHKVDPDKIIDAVINLHPEPEKEDPVEMKLIVLKSRDLATNGKVYHVKREGQKLTVVPEIEADTELNLWKLEPAPRFHRAERPDSEGWWCCDYLVGVTADSACQVVARPEGLTILGFSEEPKLVNEIRAIPDGWVGPFFKVKR